MSAAILVLGLLALLLVLGLVAALAVLARVETKHEEAVGIRTEDRPKRAGSSGDLHLFVAFPEAVALAPRFRSAAEVVSDSARDLVLELAASLDAATHGHAEFGHFRPISVQPLAGHTIVYVHARTRKPVATFVDVGSRAAHLATLEAIAALPPADLIEVRIGAAALSGDTALGRLVALT